MFTPGWPITNS